MLKESQYLPRKTSNSNFKKLLAGPNFPLLISLSVYDIVLLPVGICNKQAIENQIGKQYERCS